MVRSLSRIEGSALLTIGIGMTALAAFTSCLSTIPIILALFGITTSYWALHLTDNVACDNYYGLILAGIAIIFFIAADYLRPSRKVKRE